MREQLPTLLGIDPTLLERMIVIAFQNGVRRWDTTVHIPGLSNPADWLSRPPVDPEDRPTGTVLAAVGAAESGPLFLGASFSAALRAAVPTDQALGPQLREATAYPDDHVSAATLPVPAGPGTFSTRDGLLYRRGPRGDCLCIPATADLRQQVLAEVHSSPRGPLRPGQVPPPRMSHRLVAGAPEGPAHRPGLAGPHYENGHRRAGGH
mmetsp:Transcript_39014/g.103088  ORF Transcript_39014/g.103088 Transcript_39014/m.103088 type:complete len:208 (-) Transcript_39014:194-817(-)